MAFDVEGARRAGYTDAEIADYLAKQRGFRINDARKAGYSDDEIVTHLSKGEVKPEKSFFDRAKETVGEVIQGVIGSNNAISGAVAAATPRPEPAPLDRSGARGLGLGEMGTTGASLGLPAPVAKAANARGQAAADRATPKPTLAADGYLERQRLKIEQSLAGIGAGLGRSAAAYLDGSLNPASMAAADAITGHVDNADRFINAPVQGDTSWEDVKAAQGIGQTIKEGAKFIAEQGPSSLAYLPMYMSPAGIGAYGVSLTGNIAQDRAENNGGARANMGDILAAAPAAAISTALDKFGFENLIGEQAGNVALRIGKAALAEGLTEGVQNPIEYAGGSLGTGAGFDAREALDQGLSGALVGAGAGGAFRGGFEAIDASGRLRGRRSDDTRTPGPGIREQAIVAAGNLTPEDLASPLSNEDIAAGRAEIASATAGSTADNALSQAGLPKVGTKINVSNLPGGASMSGVIEDVFTDDTGTGVVVRPGGGGSPMREYLDTLNELGVSITPSDALAEADAIDAALAAQASAPMEDSSPLPSAGAEVAPSSRSGRTPSASAGGATNFDIGSYMARVRQAESGGKDNAKAGTSSATGRYQFTDGTWLTTYKAVFGNSGENDAQILAKRGDGAVQDRLMQKLTQDNAAALRAAGLPVNDTTLYLAHFAGIGGARSILKVAPERSVETVLGKKAVAANSFLKGKTAGEVIAWAAGKMGSVIEGVAAPTIMADDETEQDTSDLSTIPPEAEAFVSQTKLRSAEEDRIADITEVAGFSENLTAPAPDLPTGGDMAGQAIDKEWTAFAPDSGTIGIPRAEMPQVKAEHRGAMVNFLNARGISHAEEEVAANTLKPSQAEFSPSKVEKAKGYEGGNRAILISADGYVVDGHHQWLAARDKDETVRAIRLNAPIREVLQAAHEFPSSETADGASSTNTAGPQDGGSLPPVAKGNVRLWRGNRPGEVGQNPQFTNDLEGIARPFQKGYGGPLSYVDVPSEVAEKALNRTGAAATGAEFILPPEWAARAKIVEPGESNTPRPQAPRTEGAPMGWGSTDDAPAATSSARVEETSTGKSVAVIGASEAELAAIKAAIPKASPLPPRKSDGAIVYSKKYEKQIRDALQGVTETVTPAPKTEMRQGEVGMKLSVLVRIRDGNMTTEQVQDFVRAANVRDTAGMSGTETAGSDAAAMPAQMVDLYRGGDIEAAGNRDFVKAFVNALVPTNERASMILADGSIAKGLVARMEAALLVRAFGQRPFIEKMVDATDSNVRAIGKALVEMAGKFAKLREAAQDERVDPAMDITGNIAEAVEIIERARREGKPIGDYVNQRDIFSGATVSQMTEAALRMFFARPDFTKPHGQAKLVSAMDFYVEEAMKAAPGGGLFGESTKATPDGILNLANERNSRTQPADADLFSAARQPGDVPDGESVPDAGRDGGLAGEGVQTVAREEGGSSSEPVEPTDPVDTPTANTPARIDDFGEQLVGARKDVWQSYKDRLNDAAEIDVTAEPLSKTWPEPDYQKLLDAGADPYVVAWVHAARDEIPTKPQKGWKLKGWAENVRLLRDTATKLLNDEIGADALVKRMSGELSRSLRDLQGRVDLYRDMGHSKSLKGITFSQNYYSLYRGERDVTKWVVEKRAKATAFGNWPREIAVGDTREEALAKFKAIYDAGNLDGNQDKIVRFDIYSRRGEPGFVIGKKIGKDYVDLKRFDTAKEARDFKISDAGYAELVAALEQYKDIPPERKAVNAPRIGIDHRIGADVTPEAFAEAFGFRGVQFGNYVEGERRQSDLNEAYDALMDLAGVIGVPARALSLNGELGLAFGARGKGGKGAAAAHFEPDTIVINLTKNKGAGSLAHEWWHSLDNYFSRMRAPGGYMTEGKITATDGVRPEMVQAFKDVMAALRSTSLKERSKNLDKRRTKEYWSTDIEMSARAFESYVIAKLQDEQFSNDYLANVVSEKAFGIEDAYPYLRAAEIPVVRAAFDSFFAATETRETDRGLALFSVPEAQGANENADVREALRTQLEKLRLADKVKVRLVDTLGGAAGEYRAQIVTIATDTPQGEVFTLNHEAIHVLRDLGLFNTSEWAILSAKARRETGLMRSIRQRYEAGFRQRGMSGAAMEEALIEEAVADMFARHQDGRYKAEGTTDRLFKMLRQFFEAVRNAFAGRGLRTAEGVMQDVAAGEVGAREVLPDIFERPLQSLPEGDADSDPTFDNSDIEARFQAAKDGVGSQITLRDRIADSMERTWHGITRHWINLPNVPEYAALQEKLRAIEAAPQAAKERTLRMLDDMVRDFSNEDLDLFTRKVILDDLFWDASNERDLPFGFTRETLTAERAKIDQILEAQPDQKILTAVAKRKRVNRIIAKELVDAGVLEAEAIKNPSYYRHQVLEYARAQMKIARGTGKRLRSPKWAKRMGSSLDINANLLEAEFDWLNKAFVDIPVARAIEWIKNSEHNILDRLRSEARESNRKGIEERIAEAQDLVDNPREYEAEDVAKAAALISISRSFGRNIAMGFGKVRAALESGEVEYPARFEAVANGIVEGNNDSQQPPFEFLTWMLDNNAPGAIGAAMIMKAVGQRRSWTKEVLGKAYVEPDSANDLVERLAPEGYTTWQPDEGKLLFTVKTIPERVIDEMLMQMDTPKGVDPDVVRAALEGARTSMALGGAKYTMILPEEVAATLNQLRREEVESIGKTLVREPVRLWKRWVLINPRRFLKYNINNLSGDLDAIIAGKPKALRRVGEAGRELYRVMKKGEKPSARYEEAVARGVFDSGLSVQEIPDIHTLEPFERFAKKPNLASKMTVLVLRKAWNGLQGFTQWREGVFRYALYLDFVDRLEAGESQASVGYGASRPNMVDAVPDLKDRAAMLARDLIGDYGAISHYGANLRETILPFWSWMEINTKRYWRLTANAYGQGVGKGLASSSRLTALASIKSAVLLLRMGVMFGAIMAWNSLLFGDEEDDLSEEQRMQLHMIFGRNDDGSIRTLRLQGSFSDAMNWFGWQDVMAATKEYELGRRSLGDVLIAAAKAPVNKVGTSLAPTITVPLESAFGKKLWPDMFNTRPLDDGWRNLWSTFSFENEYDGLFNRPSRGYLRSWQESVLYRRDPGEMAYGEVRGKVYDWLEREKGQTGGGGVSTPKSQAMKDYRQALKFGDLEAARNAWDRMVEFGVTENGYREMMRRAAPLGPIAKKDRQAFVDQMTEEEYQAYIRADAWYRETFRPDQIGVRTDDDEPAED